MPDLGLPVAPDPTAGQTGFLAHLRSLYGWATAAPEAADIATETFVNNAVDTATSVLSFGAGDLEPTRGAPSPATPSNETWASWLLDAAAVEGVGASFLVPDGWATAAVEAWWANAGTGTGDVRLRTVFRVAAAGAALTPAGAAAQVVVTAGAQDVVATTALAASISVTPGSLMAVAVQRMGSDATDTLANDIGVLALVVRKAS